MIQGMPIQLLNGVDEPIQGIGSDFIDVVTAKDLMAGLGNTDNDSISEKGMYDYLVKTRNTIAANPRLVTNQDPYEAIKMYDYAIKYWYTPNRDNALSVLEREENRLMGLGAIVYGDEYEELGSLDGKFWSNVKKAGKAIGKAAKAVGNAIAKYNPLSMTARVGFLAAFMVNLNNMSGKLYPAYMSLQDAQKQGVSPEQHKKMVEALNNIKKMYVGTLKGNEKKLKNAISWGSRKKWTKPVVEDQNSLEKEIASEAEAAKKMDDAVDGLLGLGAVAAAAGAAAAAPFIIKAWQYTKDLFTKGKDVVKTIVNKTPSSPKTQPKPTTTPAPTSQSNTSSETNDTDTETKNEKEMEGEVTNPNPSLMDRLKNPKTLAIIAGVAVAGLLAYKFLIKKKPSVSPAPALNGVRRKKTTKRRTSSRSRKRTNVKTLKLR